MKVLQTNNAHKPIVFNLGRARYEFSYDNNSVPAIRKTHDYLGRPLASSVGIEDAAEHLAVSKKLAQLINLRSELAETGPRGQRKTKSSSDSLPELDRFLLEDALLLTTSERNKRNNRLAEIRDCQEAVRGRTYLSTYLQEIIRSDYEEYLLPGDKRSQINEISEFLLGQRGIHDFAELYLLDSLDRTFFAEGFIKRVILDTHKFLKDRSVEYRELYPKDFYPLEIDSSWRSYIASDSENLAGALLWVHRSCQAYELLITDNIGVVSHVARRKASHIVDRGHGDFFDAETLIELTDAAVADPDGLIDAARKFDPATGNQFATFAGFKAGKVVVGEATMHHGSLPLSRNAAQDKMHVHGARKRLIDSGVNSKSITSQQISTEGGVPRKTIEPMLELMGRHKRNLHQPFGNGSDGEELSLADVLSSAAPFPEDQAVVRESLSPTFGDQYKYFFTLPYEMRSALRELAPRTRLIFELITLRNMSEEEARQAASLVEGVDISLASVSNSYTGALKRLPTLLSKTEGTSPLPFKDSGEQIFHTGITKERLVYEITKRPEMLEVLEPEERQLLLDLFFVSETYDHDLAERRCKPVDLTRENERYTGITHQALSLREEKLFLKLLLRHFSLKKGPHITLDNIPAPNKQLFQGMRKQGLFPIFELEGSVSRAFYQRVIKARQQGNSIPEIATAEGVPPVIPAMCIEDEFHRRAFEVEKGAVRAARELSLNTSGAKRKAYLRGRNRLIANGLANNSLRRSIREMTTL